MAVLENTTTSDDIAYALDVEMIENFRGEYDRLADVLGIVSPEVMAAGTALYTYEVTGKLNDSAYEEGDEVPLSEYKVEKKETRELELKPYRKLTTARAIQRGGYENAILRTDAQMIADVRADVVAGFFESLDAGTGTAEGTGLQGALAHAAAVLGDTMETNGDRANRVVHFVNPFDVADYLGKAPVTVQTVFGMDYMESFLGINDVFATNKVAQGGVVVTPAENIHMYAADFGELDRGGLSYTTQSGGLIGVAHEARYDRVSAVTNVLTACLLLAEVTNYIVKASIVEEA